MFLLDMYVSFRDSCISTDRTKHAERERSRERDHPARKHPASKSWRALIRGWSAGLAPSSWAGMGRCGEVGRGDLATAISGGLSPELTRNLMGLMDQRIDRTFGFKGSRRPIRHTRVGWGRGNGAWGSSNINAAFLFFQGVRFGYHSHP